MPPPTRDIVVIGGSAGSFEILLRLISRLPADFPASVFAVVHIGSTSVLAQILDRSAALPVRTAVSGERPEVGRVYVAPPDRHLLLHDEHMLLSRGPRENLSRPAIDPLFRSVACSFGARVIGVLLSGALNDGTAGLYAVKAGGGLAVVQDPVEAAVRDMPMSALRHVEVDHVAESDALAELLTRLVREPAGETRAIPVQIRLEAAIAAQVEDSERVREMNGAASSFTCPECGGPLWELGEQPLLRYRCRIGHAFTAEAVSVAQAEVLDRRLSELLQHHEQRALFARRRAEAAQGQGREAEAAALTERAAAFEQDAKAVARFIADWSGREDTSPERA